MCYRRYHGPLFLPFLLRHNAHVLLYFDAALETIYYPNFFCPFETLARASLFDRNFLLEIAAELTSQLRQLAENDKAA